MDNSIKAKSRLSLTLKTFEPLTPYDMPLIEDGIPENPTSYAHLANIYSRHCTILSSAMRNVFHANHTTSNNTMLYVERPNEYGPLITVSYCS